MSDRRNTLRRQRGASYVELLVATIIVSVTALPALTALSIAMQSSSAGLEMTEQQHRLAGRLDTLLAEPYATLEAAASTPNAPTSLSDPLGSADRLLVYVAGYDGDNLDGDNDPFTGADPGLLWIRVEIENTRYAYQALARDR